MNRLPKRERQPARKDLALRRDQFTASFRPLPALNFGCFEADIWIRTPVRGLRPSEAARLATLNVPKPTRRTSPPLFSEAVIESKTASTAFAASDLERPALPATVATRTFLFTWKPPYWCQGKLDLKAFGR